MKILLNVSAAGTMKILLNALFVTLEWAATASSAKAVSTGCIRNAVGSSA